MKTLKNTLLLTTLMTGAVTAVSGIASYEPAGIDYLKFMKESIEKGKCYELAISGSSSRTEGLDGNGPTRLYSFYGSGDLSAKKSLHSKLKINFTDRTENKQDDTTVWFGSRNVLPVGGLILHARNDTHIDFERLRLKKMVTGWTLNGESHEGGWNATSYSMMINQKACG